MKWPIKKGGGVVGLTMLHTIVVVIVEPTHHLAQGTGLTWKVDWATIKLQHKAQQTVDKQSQSKWADWLFRLKRFGLCLIKSLSTYQQKQDRSQMLRGEHEHI